MAISEAPSINKANSRKGPRPIVSKTVVVPVKRGYEDNESAVEVKKSPSNSSLGARNRKSASQQ